MCQVLRYSTMYEEDWKVWWAVKELQVEMRITATQDQKTSKFSKEAMRTGWHNRCACEQEGPDSRIGDAVVRVSHEVQVVRRKVAWQILLEFQQKV